MRHQHLRFSLLLIILIAGSLARPGQDIAEAQSNPVTVTYRLVSSSQIGNTVSQTVEFQITNTAADRVTNTHAAVLLASSTDHRVERIRVGTILGGQTLLSSHDFSGSADFITQAFSSATLTLAFEYDDPAGTRHSMLLTVAQTAE